MKNLDFTGLDAKKVEKVVKELNQLLADLQVYYANLRGFHWNVKGDKFYQLHEFYEGEYNEIAERLLQLDARPENRFSEYLKVSQLKENGFEPEKFEGLKYILDVYKLIIAQERRVLAAAQEADDEVTVAMIDDYLTGQEKKVWMLVATLS